MAVAAVLGGAAWAARGWWLRQRETSLEGQVALVTGGSRGLGLLLARELTREGCTVAICARDGDELQRAARLLEAEGRRPLTARCDVGDRDQVHAMVRRIERELGPLEVLVNNAGIIQVGPIASMVEDDFRRSLDVMYWGVVNPTLAALPGMRERGAGRIVNITSIGGKVAVPHLLPYTSAKFAAVGFSEGLRAELQGTGVTVTTVVPWLMRTGSYLNVEVKGYAQHEFAWFALGASLPLVSMNAERAARRIVQGARRGEAEVILSLPANLAVRFHGILPGLTSDLMGLVARVLPASGTTAARRGADVDAESPPWLRAATSLGSAAAARNNERA